MTYNSAMEVVRTITEAYFRLRDVDVIMDCITDDIIWIGMEKGEQFFGRSDIRAMLEKDMEAHPEPYEIFVDSPHIIPRSPEWVSVAVSGERSIGGGYSFKVRSFMDCVRTSDGWKINGIHTSVPNMVSEQLRLKMELTEEQIKQKTLLRGIPGGVAIYRIKTDGTVPTDFVSEGLASSLGYTAGEFLEHLREDARCNLVPEDIPGVMENVMKGLENHTPISTTYRVYDKAHRPVRIRLDANIIEKELKQDEVALLYAVHTLISEAAEQTMREQDRYRRLLNNLDIAYFEIDGDGSFYASERYYQYAVSGLDSSQVVTRCTVPRTVHPDDAPVLNHFFDLKKEKPSRASVTLRCKMMDGTYRWTEMSGIFEYAPDGHLIRQTGVFRDAENEWVEQNQRLLEALAIARQASQSKTEFFSRVSHDIRTPLNAILGFTHMAEEQPDGAVQIRECLAKIRNSGEYLLGLVNDVLDMSKIESDSFQLHEEVVNGPAFLNNIADMFSEVARQNDICLVTDFSEAQTPWVLMDPLRSRQIYSNLLSNAIKFSGRGTTVTWTVRDVIADDRMDMVSVIKDEGCGMSEAYLQRIFTPFAQERNPYSDHSSGTGLGLSIVKSLVDRMGGSIEVESRLGVGSVFTLRLSRKLSPVPPKSAAAEAGARKVSLEGKRILLCEDHPMNREIAVFLLEKKEMLVDQAENGLVGLRTFETAPAGRYDAILMDILMPEMDGLECARHIRALSRPDAQSIPIIAMTANAYVEDIQEALAAGMNAHISKPVDPERLYAVLTEQLEGCSL